MKLLLTPELLKFLKMQGFKYCLSQTTLCGSNEGNDVTITLKPVKSRPSAKNLPLYYDTFFPIDGEPVQMAEGMDDNLSLVLMDKETMQDYLKTFLLPVYLKGCPSLDSGLHVITGP